MPSEQGEETSVQMRIRPQIGVVPLTPSALHNLLRTVQAASVGPCSVKDCHVQGGRTTKRSE